MTRFGAIRWVALALVGLAVAAGVSLAAGRVLSERIGLAAEPVSAGRKLAPASREQASANGHKGDRAGRAHQGDHAHPPAGTTTTTNTPTTSAPTAPPTTAPPPPSSRGEHEGADD